MVDDINDINDLLNVYRSKKSGKTDTLFRNGNEHFSVSKEKIGDFMDKFCSLVKDDVDEEKGLAEDIGDMELSSGDGTYNHFGHSLYEVYSGTSVPVNFNFTFRLKDSQGVTDGNLYSKDFITTMIYSIQQGIVASLDVSSGLGELNVLMEQSKMWNDKKNNCFNVKLFFPYCRTKIDYQNTELLETCIKYLDNNNVLDRLNHECVGSWHDFFTPTTNSILMYRGKKDENETPCTLKGIYGPITDQDIENNIDISCPLNSRVFNIMQSSAIKENPSFKAVISKDVDINYWYPIFRSVHFWSSETSPKNREKFTPDLKSGTPINYSEVKNDFTDDPDAISSKDPKVMINFLIGLLSEKRYTIEPYLYDVIQCVYNIFSGNKEGLTLLIKCNISEVTNEKIKEIYHSLEETHLTIKTIGFYASEDNPERYKEWHDSWCESSIYEALTCFHDHVAEALYRTFWLNHIWVGGKRWYTFKGHSLREQSSNTELRRNITDVFVKKYKLMRKNFQNAAAEAKSQIDVKASEEASKKTSILISKLLNHTFKSTIIKASEPLFEVQDFDSIKDSNPSKIGWKNCVITCHGNHAYIINGKLEDYITKSTFRNYRSDLTWDHPLVVELKDWFSKMFPDPELMKYMFKDASSYLYGRNLEKLLRAWCGDGNNSKTMYGKCLQEAFGSYCIDFPPSFLTAKAISSSGPSPELAQAKGAHIGLIPETEEDEKIREGSAKRTTGGDRQYARNCNENGGSSVMGCKIILMCNKIPEFTFISKALIARFVNIPFLGNWSNDAPESLEEQRRQNHYKMDVRFEDRLPHLSLALAWVAVQYYPIYKKEGLITPDIIKRYTREHWENNDPVLCFVQERLENVYTIDENGSKQVDSNQTLSCTQIYTVYKSWFTQRYPGTTPAVMTSFQVSLTLQLGEPGPSKKWCGISIVQMAANTSNGQASGGNDMESINI